MDDDILSAMRRAVEAAHQGISSPETVLTGRFTGQSRAGTATAWVDFRGQLERLELAPGSVQEGDEAGIAAAVLEAYTAARLAALNFARSSLADAQPAAQPSVDDEDFSTSSPLSEAPADDPATQVEQRT